MWLMKQLSATVKIKWYSEIIGHRMACNNEGKMYLTASDRCVSA